MANISLKKLWESLSNVSNTIENKTDAKIVQVLDLVLRSKAAELALGTVMIGNNTASMYKNNHGQTPIGQLAGNTIKGLNKEGWQSFLSAIIAPGAAVSSLAPGLSTLVQQAMVEPNISGIPISSSKIETDKNVDISEQVVILQSLATKQYWTDNAVPRLKEWTITGYLTSLTLLDTGLMIKPSLVWQLYFLDKCADSRRPVLFKTNHNEFVQVQIMNLHTIEEASYNNAIEISLTLKEYRPYLVDASVGEPMMAVYQGSRLAS